jgi:hypothetical protein
VVAADDADVDELLRVGDGETAQADFVEELEDGGVGSDAERERGDGGGGDSSGHLTRTA